MTQYWRIHSNPQELEDMFHNDRMQTCLNEEKIFVGNPDTLGAFRDDIKIGDYFITRDEESFYIGEITSDFQKHSNIGGLHYRDVKWFNDKNSVGAIEDFFGQQHQRTCTQIEGQDAIDLQEIIENL